MKQIITCKFLDSDGNPRGREYSYYSEIPVEPGQYVDVPAAPRNDAELNTTKKVIVVRTNIPEKEVEAFKSQIKTIVGIHKEE